MIMWTTVVSKHYTDIWDHLIFFAFLHLSVISKYDNNNKINYINFHITSLGRTCLNLYKYLSLLWAGVPTPWALGGSSTHER